MNRRWMSKTKLPAGVAILVLAGSAFSTTDARTASGSGFDACTDEAPSAGSCVTGSDPPPAGVNLWELPTTSDLEQMPFVVTAAETNEEAPATAASDRPIACIGDGSDGARVQLIYARASDRPDRSAELLSLIRRYAQDMDYRVDIGSSASGGGRRIRYVHDASCALTIARVTLSPTGDDTFGNFVTELREQGFTRTDRKYLAWVDAAVGICGLAQIYADDRPTADNRNNRGPQYGRVDTPCWGHAETHELLHLLGAVQDSAPNSTKAGHCIDELDVMCYSDTSGLAMQHRCPTGTAYRIDCGFDDYLNVRPPSGSYLDGRWNLARSAYLQPTDPLPPPPTVTISAPSTFFAGTLVEVRATPSAPGSRRFTISWSSSRPECSFTRSSGETTTFFCPVRSVGSGQIIAKVVDSLGLAGSTSHTYRLDVPARPRKTSTKLTLPTTTTVEGEPLTVAGRVIDPVTAESVVGMPVVLFRQSSASGDWVKITSRRTKATGRVAFDVVASRTTAYVLVSGMTKTWSSDESAAQSVTVT